MVGFFDEEVPCIRNSGKKVSNFRSILLLIGPKREKEKKLVDFGPKTKVVIKNNTYNVYYR